MKREFNDTLPSLPDGLGLLFPDILDALDDPVLVIDSQFTVHYGNLAFGKIFGYSPAEDRAPSFLALLSKEEAEEFAGQVAACIQSGKAGFTAVCRFAGAAEEWETFEIHGKARHDPEGGISFTLHLHCITELIREKRDSADRELRYQALAEQASDAFFVHDFSGRFVEVNRRACESLGYTREELLTMSVTDVEQDFDLKSAQAQWANIKPGADFTLYGHQKRKDGALIPVEVRFGCSIWNGEKLFLGMVRDIAERRRAEQELLEKEAFSRAVMDHLPIGIAVNSVTPKVNFAYMNDNFSLFYRTRREYLLGHDAFWEAVYEDPAYREEIKTRVLADVASGDPGRMAWEDIPITRKGEETRYISAYNTPVPGGQLVISTVMDVTRRIRAEQALQKHAKRLEMLHEIDRAILSGSESPQAIAEAALRRIYSLLAAKRVSIDIFEPDGMDLRVLAVDVGGETVVSAQRQRLKEIYGDLELLGEGKGNIVEDVSQKMPSSHVSDILKGEGICSFMLVPLTAAGLLIGVLSLGWEAPRTVEQEEKAIAQEVAAQLAVAMEQSRMRTELAQHAAVLEQRVRQRTAQYEAANKELEAFSYSVSHDLRAPLRSVDGYVQILLEDYSNALDENGKRVCNVISSSAKQMGQLIDDLLSLSRVGRTDMRRYEVDMGGLVHSIYHELTTQAERASIDMHIGPLPRALADPTLIRQVWMNLLSNAVKFSSKKEKTVIRVEGEVRDGEAVYWIRDQGAGFDQQYADKLFGVFQRLHSSKEFEGTGVGLAIVQRIVNRHGGNVWAEGKPGEGAVFYFSLKREDSHGPL